MAPDFAAFQAPLPSISAAVGITLSVKVSDTLALSGALDPVAVDPAAIKGCRLPARGGGEFRGAHGAAPWPWMAKMFAGSTPSIFSKVPKPSASFGHLRQLLAGAGEHRFGPRRLPVSLVAQLHNTLQQLFKCQADRPLIL
jgi:hypothetical protein